MDSSGLSPSVPESFLGSVTNDPFKPVISSTSAAIEQLPCHSPTAMTNGSSFCKTSAAIENRMSFGFIPFLK
jgi:hypothetical protein